jgi:hypothetical protein
MDGALSVRGGLIKLFRRKFQHGQGNGPFSCGSGETGAGQIEFDAKRCGKELIYNTVAHDVEIRETVVTICVPAAEGGLILKDKPSETGTDPAYPDVETGEIAVERGDSEVATGDTAAERDDLIEKPVRRVQKEMRLLQKQAIVRQKPMRLREKRVMLM